MNRGLTITRAGNKVKGFAVPKQKSITSCMRSLFWNLSFWCNFVALTLSLSLHELVRFRLTVFAKFSLRHEGHVADVAVKITSFEIMRLW